MKKPNKYLSLPDNIAETYPVPAPWKWEDDPDMGTCPGICYSDSYRSVGLLGATHDAEQDQRKDTQWARS